MQVTLHRDFAEQLNAFADYLRNVAKQQSKDLETKFRRVGQRWRAGAVRRIPVDEGTAKARVVTNTYREGLDLITEVGGNVPYMVWLEFGTDKIAGGRVKALGLDEHITDAQAVHNWPAKDGEAIAGTSAMHTTDSRGVGRLRNSSGQFLKGSPQEQMPWLRPAFMEIADWVLDEIGETLAFPKPSTGGKGL
jgi:hypothetical protein